MRVGHLVHRCVAKERPHGGKESEPSKQKDEGREQGANRFTPTSSNPPRSSLFGDRALVGGGRLSC